MTTETRTTIEPADISAIELECVTCHFRARRLLADWRQDSLSCSNCGAAWMLNGSADVQNLKMLISLLRGLTALNPGTKSHPFMIRLEIAEEGTPK